MAINAEIRGFDEARDSFKAMSEAAPGTTDDALKEFADETMDELKRTSPYDTGEYYRSWEIIEIAEDEVWIVNTAPHAKYVAFPNAAMYGVTSADDPARGILHNVRGIVHRRERQMKPFFRRFWSGILF